METMETLITIVNIDIFDIIMHSDIWMWEIIILIYSELWDIVLIHGI